MMQPRDESRGRHTCVLSACLVNLLDVDVRLAEARVSRQGAHEGVGLLDHERSLACPGVDQSKRGEHLDGFADGVP
jgi:hypothetical protein